MEIHERVVAKRFVLVDDDGNPTAYITNAKAGFTGLSVQPASGEDGPIVSLGVQTESGQPVILLSRPDNSSVLITIRDDGEATVRLEDADGAAHTITSKSE